MKWKRKTIIISGLFLGTHWVTYFYALQFFDAQQMKLFSQEFANIPCWEYMKRKNLVKEKETIIAGLPLSAETLIPFTSERILKSVGCDALIASILALLDLNDPKNPPLASVQRLKACLFLKPGAIPRFLCSALNFVLSGLLAGSLTCFPLGKIITFNNQLVFKLI